MSVSLALVPVALTMRIAMGKQNFDDWVESMQVKIPSRFTERRELVRTIHNAGYDAEEWTESLMKTHFQKDNYFFWELIDGQWTAVFGKDDDQNEIARFLKKINQAAGWSAFDSEYDVERNVQLQRQSPPSVFPTNFREGDLLFKTLKEFGINPTRGQDESISCRVEGSTLIFRQQGDSPFQVEIRNAPDLQKVYGQLSSLDEDYKRQLQSRIYEKLKQRAAERNMTVENEEVLEDNSIVLTLNIRD
ncbi:hypothetical protein HGI30_00820 [Paenibacillus albicereus]|uniref:Uncharacterized protein n=1 Tax=Paenibacillus albicereus TaxID=2726185 RepID=A0A6H2GSB5_9BACL|nr:hypothetical protein [Paenibacillus albicereus]QJC50285.1 hypothetical protein HGI30_00820 [Paenibacillus albicereus]